MGRRWEGIANTQITTENKNSTVTNGFILFIVNLSIYNLVYCIYSKYY